MISKQKIKKIVNFSISGCQYLFDNPIVVNLMQMPEKVGWIAVSKGYDEHFIGTGHTPTQAYNDWSMKFHYNYQKMETYDDIDPNLKAIMDGAVDRKVYETYEPLVVKKKGEVVATRFPEGCPSAIRWKGSKSVVPVPMNVFKDFLFYEKGTRFTAVAEYDRQTYRLSKILYSEREAKHEVRE